MTAKKANLRFASLWEESRGQVSIEMVLLAAAMMLMGIIIYPFITTEITLDKASAAARDGATAMVGIFNMGYKFTPAPGETYEGPQKSMRLKEVNLVYTGAANDIRYYSLNAVIDFPEDETSVNKTRVGNTVLYQAMNHLNYAFTSTWFSADDDSDSVNVSNMVFYYGNVTWE